MKIIPTQNKNVVLQEGTVITLKEITDMIGVQHSKAMAKVEELTREDGFGGLSKMDTPTYNPDGSENKTISTYALTKKQAIAAAARLNNSMLMVVINKLEELENAPVKRKEDMSVDELLDMAILMREERNKAIATKAEIGSRREATAMATASAEKRRADKLSIRLDESEEWATIKKVEMRTSAKYKWSKLKRASKQLGINPRKVFDENYGELNSYHKSAWWEAYRVDIGGMG